MKCKRYARLTAALLCLALLLTACGGAGGVAEDSAGSAPSQAEAAGEADGGAPEPGAAGEDEIYDEVVLRFGTTSAENTVVVATMRDFAHRVSDRTGGRVVVEIFPASQLGSTNEMVQSVQMGALDICMSQPASLADMGVDNMSTLVLPYIFSSFDQRWNVLYGEIGDELLEEVTGAGMQLRGFGYFLDGARSFFTVEGKPIRSIEDVQGMKLRVQSYDIDNDMAIALGASPTPTSSSEMYSAMQSGIVDGAEQPIAAYYGSKFYEVSSYLTLDEHTYNTLVVLFSELSWNRLNPATQEVLQAAWDDASRESKEAIVSTDEELLDLIRDEGVEIIELTDRERWVEAMLPLYEKHAADKMDLVERIRAVQ